MFDLAHQSVWPFILILGYPVLAIAVLELANRVAGRATFAAGILRQLSYVLLPTGAIWLILRVLADLPADNWGVRTAETAFALTGLYLLLRVAQAILMSLVDHSRFLGEWRFPAVLVKRLISPPHRYRPGGCIRPFGGQDRPACVRSARSQTSLPGQSAHWKE